MTAPVAPAASAAVRAALTSSAGARLELIEPDVGDGRARDHRPGDGRAIDLGALDHDVERLGLPGPLDRQADLRALRAAHEVDDLVELRARGLRVVDGDDDVAATEAGLLRRAVGEDVDDARALLVGVDLDADADERAGQVLPRVLALGRGQEAGVAGVTGRLGEARRWPRTRAPSSPGLARRRTRCAAGPMPVG